MLLADKLSPVIIEIGNFSIRWYAVFIMIGALLTLAFSQWAMKRGGYSKDILNTLFFVAFPMGLVGARLWWCIADSGSPWKNGDVLGFFRVWEGGLAVQGGVILGAAAGIGYMIWKFKDASVRYAMDAVIPNILVAQAMGRWGNFFNQEVYGSCIKADTVNYLPGFIKNQMMGGNGGMSEYVGSGIKCSSDEMAQPLFLYECLLNLLGWALINFVLRIFWKKGYHKCDLAACYLIWYGVVRVILEPMRNQEYIMDGLWGIPVSVYTSILFIVLGVAMMVAFRIYDYKKKNKVQTSEGQEVEIEENKDEEEKDD